MVYRNVSKIFFGGLIEFFLEVNQSVDEFVLLGTEWFHAVAR